MPALTPANDLIRARNVTASEVGALMGEKHPYSTPDKIYDRLASTIPMFRGEQSEAMALGSFMEPYIARYAAQRYGLKLRASMRSIEHPKVNLCATPDYFILGKRGLVEVKLSGITYAWTEDTLQPHIKWQARAQMACANRDFCIVIALVGSALYQVIVNRDNDEERRMLETVDKFMHDHVFLGIRPEEQSPRGITAIVEGK